MIKTKIFALLFSLLTIGSFAQEEEISFQSIENESARDKFILSLSLLSQLDINTPSLQLGFDIKITETIGIHQELGYINNWLNPLYAYLDQEVSQNYKLKNGVKYIFEPRFYPFNKEKKISKSMFFAPSFDFRYVNIKRNSWVGRYNFSYRQNLDYHVNKLAFGGMFKFGFTTKPNKRMPIDLVFGLGTRYSTRSSNLPEDAEFINNGRGFFFSGRALVEGNQWHPAAYFGLLLHLPVFK